MRVPRTFAFVDLSGFTNYTAAFGDDAAGRLLGAFRALAREMRHLRRDRWDLAGITLLPGILIFIVAALFWQGPFRQLPLGIADSDGSGASRAIIRAMDA